MSGKNEESFSFVKTEHDILKYWKEHDVFQKTLEKTKDGAPYLFYDGPPFATGLPHHGHLVGSTLKDVIPRYFTMKGRYVERRFGWDCHGLPIENEIDKKLGMPAQEAVAKLGIKKYSDECRSIVQRYTGEWRKTIERIGRWVDMDNDYKTMDTSFMESVWWVVKQLWEKDLIYNGTKVVPFSTGMGTVLSNFEAGLDYRDVQDPAVTVLFKFKDEDHYISAWTTTPWTLPSNLGLCVGQDIDYCLVKDIEKDIQFYIAKDLISSFDKKGNKFEIQKEVKGEALVGKEYEPLFDFFKDIKSQGAFKIFSDNYVSTDAGTGIVHLAPFGEDDDRILKANGIKKMPVPVDNAGKFTSEITDWSGIQVKEADKLIIKELKEKNQLYKQDVIVHSYPFCYRSKKPLIYKPIPSWYVKVEQMRDQLQESNDQVNWVPGHIKQGRFGKWLAGAKDWAISRNRVWGTPLPIWFNENTKNYICIGSVSELEKYSGVRLDDLHREFVDEITFSIEGEEGEYKRIPEVLDCWFESGSMPYAQSHYPFKNAESFEQMFPAEFIAEGLDQTRGWFYTLTVLSTALFGKPAFKNVIVNGIVLAKDGAKMSKSLRNYTAPDILMEEFGADALRLFLINSPLVRGEELKFSDTGVKDMVRRVLLPWYNSFKFFSTYSEIDGWNPREHHKIGDNILDQWLLSKLQSLVAQVEIEMEKYHIYNVIAPLFSFIDDLTNWYIRLNRRRFWAEGLDSDKQEAYSVLYTTLVTISELMAPFAPFLSEFTYLQLKEMGKEDELSVHLRNYPKAQANRINKELENSVKRMQEVILLGRQKRNKEQIKVKTPLQSITLIHSDQEALDSLKELENYVKTELNIKDVIYDSNEEDYIKLYAKPNSPVLGKRFGKSFGQFRNHISKLSSNDLRRYEETHQLELKGELFSGDDLLIFREAQEGSQAQSNRFISVNLNCTLSDELVNEGIAREIVNRIQKTRKEINFNVADRIQMAYEAEEKLELVLNNFKDHIAKETLLTQINSGLQEGRECHDFEIDGMELKIQLWG